MNIALPNFHTPMDCMLAVRNFASESPLWFEPISELCELPERHNQRSSHAWTSSVSCPLSWKMSTHLGIRPREPNHSRLIQEAITVHSPISRPQPIIPQWIQTHRPILEIHYINKNPILLSMAIHGPRRRETTRARDHYPIKNLTSKIYLSHSPWRM